MQYYWVKVYTQQQSPPKARSRLVRTGFELRLARTVLAQYEAKCCRVCTDLSVRKRMKNEVLQGLTSSYAATNPGKEGKDKGP